MKIILDETPGTTYPAVIKSVGEAPKQFGNVVAPTAAPAASDDFDFLNEMSYGEEDAEDFTEIADTDEIGEEDKTIAVEDEEEDEFGSEFSDDEGFEDDSKLSHGDDY